MQFPDFWALTYSPLPQTQKVNTQRDSEACEQAEEKGSGNS